MSKIIDKDTGIWSLQLAKKHKCDYLLAETIPTYYKPKKFADLGCGNGQYCAIFKSIGWNIVHGYEGTPNIKSLGVYDDIMTIDLSQRRYVDIDYDLVLCLEVGEHIPRKHEQIFIENVCEFTSKYLILSWAIPGQGGTGHYNEQPNEYIIEQFVNRGLKLSAAMTHVLRNHSTLPWFKNTIMVFKR